MTASVVGTETVETGQSGLFVVVVGPRGAGTGSVCATLAELLRLRGQTVQAVTDPSNMGWGRLPYAEKSRLHSRAVALHLAAGRYANLANEVVPALERGAWVVSNGYIQSSLVLEQFAGLSVAETWSYNRHVRQPDLSVYLRRGAEAIALQRVGATRLSRPEAIQAAERELRLYGEACEFLEARGWPQEVVRWRGQTAEQLAERIVARLEAFDRCQGDN
ncbi:dTMP kinase [Fodinicola acaciae]|uniref:dTMP kinase n=1 Tax=Fodinicola acaciae TaxID=2681555 RepID=UPI0013D87000|nr:hypothetical protein [Fodinicola acaciae]